MDPTSGARRSSCTPEEQAGTPLPPVNNPSTTITNTTSTTTESATTTSTPSLTSSKPTNSSAQIFLRYRSQSLSSALQHEFLNSAGFHKAQAANGDPFASTSAQPSSSTSSSSGIKCLSFEPLRKNMARLLKRASQSFRSTPSETSTASSSQEKQRPSPSSTPSFSPSFAKEKFKDAAQKHQTWHGDENLSGSEQETSAEEQKFDRMGFGGRLKQKLEKRRASMSHAFSSEGEEDVLSDGESGFFQDEEEMPEKPIVVKRDFTIVLPPEVATHVFSFIDTKTLLQSCSLVSKRWNALIDDPYVWQNRFQTEFGPWKYKPGNDWKKMARAYKEINGRWDGRKDPVNRKNDPAVSYFSGHRDNVYCVQFDEDKVLTGSRDHTVRVWDIRSQVCTQILGDCTVSSDHPDYPLYQRKDPNHIGVHKQSVLCLQFDKEILVTGSSDHTCIVWSLPGYIPIRRLSQHTGGVLDVAFDAEHIITCSKDTTIAVWDRKTLTLKHTFLGHNGPVNAIAIKDDFVISASGDATVKMWSISQKKLVKTFAGHERGLACVQISDDAKQIVSGGNDKMIRIWDVETGKCIKELDGHRNLVRTLQLDCKHRRIISGSYDMTVRVWNLDSGKTILSIKRYHSTSVLAAKADYRRLISASQDNKVVMHDFAAGVDGAELLDFSSVPQKKK